MKQRPILFTDPMVRALLDGSKTQTRRAGKTQCAEWLELAVEYSLHAKKGKVAVATHRAYPNGTARHGICECPYGIPGDQLWVREAFRTVAMEDALPPRELTPAHRIWYEADTPHQPGIGKLRPGMFMPRWASRITLEITGVRVERLQDISDHDAIAEGAEQIGDCDGAFVAGYHRLWETINGPGSWDANPWVWVVEFKRIEGTSS